MLSLSNHGPLNKYPSNIAMTFYLYFKNFFAHSFLNLKNWDGNVDCENGKDKPICDGLTNFLDRADEPANYVTHFQSEQQCHVCIVYSGF